MPVTSQKAVAAASVKASAAKAAGPSTSTPSEVLSTPGYWQEACKHLVKKDRVMKRLIRAR